MKIYMFHYVKPFSNYHYFDVKEFEKIIKDLSKRKKIISFEEMINLKENNPKKIEDKVLLTFDDGTIDHYNYVYPILKKYNCSGLFFITSCIQYNKILDIQMIHELLKNNSINVLYDDLKEQLNLLSISIEDYISELSLDNVKTASFKQLLQYKLPLDVRNNILNYFCVKYKIDRKINRNYIGLKELKKMKKDGMCFGLHTVSHPRLSLLSEAEQEKEIINNLQFLKKNNIVEMKNVALAFPFGSYNDITLKIMNNYGIKYGFKVDEKKSNYFNKNIILFDRIDCNILKEKKNEKVY